MARKEFAGYLEAIQAMEGGDMLLEMLRLAAQRVMEEEVSEHVGAERHERSSERRGHRNGYKGRKLKTRLGELDLSVPQVRGMEPYSPGFFAKWSRSERALLVACAEMYFMGVSTRKVKRVLQRMSGFELSASTVSCVARELDETLAQFRSRRLEAHAWPYLMVDACYIRVRTNGRVVNQAVLVVAGITESGDRHILTWQVAPVESADTWSEVFRDLRRRGITGVEWVVSDGHEGIQAAVAEQFGASWQRCWTHFIRNVMAKVASKQQHALRDALVDARRFEDPKTCLMHAELVAQSWGHRYPRVAAQIRAQFEETLAVHGLPGAHRKKLYDNQHARARHARDQTPHGCGRNISRCRRC